MKTKNFLRNVIFILVIFMIFGNLNAQMKLKDRYYIGSYGNGGYNTQGVIYFYKQNSIHWSNYGELNFNLKHQYLPEMDWDYEIPVQGEKMIGSFYDDINSYMNNLNNIFLWSYGHNLNLLLERWKTNFAGFGQRSTYQAEDGYEGSTVIKWINQRPGYGYSDHQTGSDFEDLSQSPSIWVRKCHIGTDAPSNFIVCNLHENCEQVSNIGLDLRFSDVKSIIPGEPYCWYIKPRMRIEGWENLPINTPVVRIEINRYDGQPAKLSIVLTIDNFRENGNLTSNYIELFDFGNPPPEIYPLSVTGAELNQNNPGNWESLYNSKVDYRVWWYGNVDVYLDYVRVDDEWAHFLFNPGTDIEGDRWKFTEKLTGYSGEATVFNEYPGFGQFHSDEFQYNNIDCIVKTKEIIESASSGHLTLMPVFNFNCIHALSLRNLLKYDDNCIDDFINRGLFKDFIEYDVYPFALSPFWNTVQYPHNLTYEDDLCPTNIDPVITALYNDNQASNSEQYNDTLQDKLEFFTNMGNGNYQISQMYCFRLSANALKRARMQSKDISLSYIDQIHNDETNIGYLFREPTNEEISFQAFLGLAYGAKQSIHYEYNTEVYYGTNGRYDYRLYGLAGESGNKRTQNIYKYSDDSHQNKWNGVCSLDLKLKAIGDYLYPPGQPNKHKYYLDTRTVNTYPPIRDKPNYLTIIRGLNEPAQYISNIKSIKRDPGTNNWSDNYWDSEEKRYWELGFFDNNPNDPDIFSEKYSHYFIAVNKRCTPETPGSVYDGDLRKLKIRFDENSPELAGFNNWKLIDPTTGNTIAIFDKTQWVDAGIFQPGEGKLFKLAPVF